jgi:hypothetical protein
LDGYCGVDHYIGDIVGRVEVMGRLSIMTDTCYHKHARLISTLSGGTPLPMGILTATKMAIRLSDIRSNQVSLSYKIAGGRSIIGSSSARTNGRVKSYIRMCVLEEVQGAED